MIFPGGFAKTATQVTAPKQTTPNPDYRPFTQIGSPVEFHYIVQEGDTLSYVASMLYGSNTKHTRNALRKQGFAPGVTVTATH